MENSIEAVPHIDFLREIQPLVLDGLNFSKVLQHPSSAIIISHAQNTPLFRRRCSCNSLLLSTKKYRISGPSCVS
jgi:hypothetical protein